MPLQPHPDQARKAGNEDTRDHNASRADYGGAILSCRSHATTTVRNRPRTGISKRPPQLSELEQPDLRDRWLKRFRNKPWVVYSKAPFAGPRKLLDSLGRYTHRTAISNHRLVSCDGGRVVYRYRDRQDNDRLKTDELPAAEFIRRFLQHVLPNRFWRIRHYGLLANCVKRKHLARCRELLAVPVATSQQKPRPSAAEWLRTLLGIDITRCPCCGESLRRDTLKPRLVSTGDVRACSPSSNALTWDTS